ncbi:gamma-glutamylcyclotransferase-like [Carcharodon carcharias]|uniref:gamma-glutamylcyclotransferase-like n=1 Tax=Carcharodon carcharias TaxID=13397 RepID=UPI001B7E6A39|nr:gamma-glutamylcyclotransferase-like [Carcharodon carcharias]
MDRYYAVFLLVCVIWSGYCVSIMTVSLNDTERNCDLANGQDFCYFGYGSNLLRERLLLKNPSAVQVAVGCLKGYKLAFGFPMLHENNWGGGAATIITSPEDDVWGVIWRMKAADRASLDDQEGVKKGLYSPTEVIIQRENAGDHTCLTYQMNNFTSALPSPIYKEVICTGAKRGGLPAEYIKKLDAIKTNNYNGTNPLTLEIREILNQLQNNISVTD